MSNDVKKELASLQADYPDLNIAIVDDGSDMIVSSLMSVAFTLILGIVNFYDYPVPVLWRYQSIVDCGQFHAGFPPGDVPMYESHGLLPQHRHHEQFGDWNWYDGG